MVLSTANLLKVWITVVLSASILTNTLGVESTSSPLKITGDRKPPLPAAYLNSLSQRVFNPGADRPIGTYLDAEDQVYVDDDGENMGTNEEDEENRLLMKKSMGMLRLGRSPRSHPMVAQGLGRSVADVDSWRPNSMSAWKRTMGMLRLGRRSEREDEEDEEEDDREEDKRSMGMLRLGRRSQEEDKRSMGMLRLGRSVH